MAEHIYNDVPVMIPGIKLLDPEMVDDEPWKAPVPIYYLGDKKPIPYTIVCEELKYFMTDSKKALKEELGRYGLKMPDFSDFEPNPALAHSVRLKMIELGVCWSIAKSTRVHLINYYTKEKGAFYFPLKTEEDE